MVNRLGLILFIVLFLSNISQATNEGISIKNNSNDENISQEYLTNSKHTFSIGTEMFSYLYKEPNLMKTRGNSYGINASYSYCLDNNLCFQPELRLNKGKEHYKSNYSGNDKKKTPNSIFEIRTLLKKFIPLSELKIEMYPFIGIGYRYKKDNSYNMVTDTGFIGWLRKSQYYYIPLGLNVDFNLTQEWSLSVLGEYDLFLKGIQRSHNKFISVKNTQKQGYGFRSEILLNRNFNKHILSVGPFVNYWNIKKSKTTDIVCNHCGRKHIYYVEPKNTTTELGIRIKYSF
jgi:hypothetical protein